MATQNFSTVFEQTSDATFRNWGLELSTALQATGLAQTADTGQINWTTVLRPTTASASAGYEVYAFTDTLQATDPIFIKIEYGSGPLSNGQQPGIWITIGTSTNGAGTLGGSLSARTPMWVYDRASGGIRSYSTPYQSYICFDGSYLGVVHKLEGCTAYNGGIWPNAAFMIGRPCDNTGAYIGGGYIFLHNKVSYGTPQNNPWTMYCMNTATGVSYTTDSYFSLAPYGLSATLLASGDIQVFPCFSCLPLISPINWAIYGVVAETAQGATAHTAVVGATAQDYLMIGSAAYGAALPNDTLHSLMMKFQ
jgi:hypothetical protein